MWRPSGVTAGELSVCWSKVSCLELVPSTFTLQTSTLPLALDEWTIRLSGVQEIPGSPVLSADTCVAWRASTFGVATQTLLSDVFCEVTRVLESCVTPTPEYSLVSLVILPASPPGNESCHV